MLRLYSYNIKIQVHTYNIYHIINICNNNITYVYIYLFLLYITYK